MARLNDYDFFQNLDFTHPGEIKPHKQGAQTNKNTKHYSDVTPITTNKPSTVSDARSNNMNTWGLLNNKHVTAHNNEKTQHKPQLMWLSVTRGQRSELSVQIRHGSDVHGDLLFSLAHRFLTLQVVLLIVYGCPDGLGFRVEPGYVHQRCVVRNPCFASLAPYQTRFSCAFWCPLQFPAGSIGE